MTSNDFGHLTASAVEKKVEEIWKDVLGMAESQASATFFELSGQSIAAVLIVNRIEEELGILVDVADLFEDPDLDTFVRDVVAKFESSSAN